MVRIWNSSTRFAPQIHCRSRTDHETLQTETDDVPLALIGFQGRLVAGVGKALRIYDVGKKKLLRKVENKVIVSVLFHLSMSDDIP